MTIIVNLMGAPGCGKSTIATGVYYNLKIAGINVEYSAEYAKDLVYEERHLTLRCQPYIFGKQLRNLERLIGNVDVIVSDSPLLLCSYYNLKYRKGVYPDSFDQMVVEQYKKLSSMTYLIDRVKPYQTVGRLQTADESDQVGRELNAMLDQHDISYKRINGDESAVPYVTANIITTLTK